ncbi:MAG: serine hydrolase [Gemmatimonadales bacterium]|nr:serine hydrolase [Gemmatimonadales bacterium]
MTRTLLTGLLVTTTLAGCRPARLATTPAPERADPSLQAELESLVGGFKGEVGLYVRHLRTGQTAGINADSVFPTQSVVKVPILVGTFDAIHRGVLDYRTRLVYTDSLLYRGVDIIGGLKDSATIALGQVAMLMITTSDNTGSLWLQHLAGTGTTINAWMAAHGFEHTRVNSRTPGREANQKLYGWGQTTPREMSRLMLMIRDGKAVSQAASEEMYRALTRVYWNGAALAAIPPWVQVASKQGWVRGARSETAVVNAPSGDYVFTVSIWKAADEGLGTDSEPGILMQQISALLWRYFEPQYPWRPDPDATKYKP